MNSNTLLHYRWSPPLGSCSPTEINRSLDQRDISAIAYSKSLLLEGDTLVFIRYPRDQELFDPAGFKLSSKSHRVHSQKLLATGSVVFQKLFSDRDQQRARRIAGYTSTNPLPNGIQYILDLTPPDEGDVAVELTTSLSCSLGIRKWATTAPAFGVDPKHVAGRDEFARLPHYPIEEETPNQPGNEDEDVKPAKVVDEIPEYCPIRHRAGIERLLRIIEGRGPNLDSAPKVLTLAVLGKYFDCTQAVAGFIESWIMTEPNNKFIEILPEAAFQIGLYLHSKMIIEPAFAVLVSEGAFLAAARMKSDFEGCKNNATLFGRPKEDINEDELNRIEAAANDFQSRINGVATKLTHPSMAWIQDLREYRKLHQFQEHAPEGSKARLAVDKLIKLLGHYVRGRIIAVSMQPISDSHNTRANSNRGFEHYLEPYERSFGVMYDTMSPDERYLTWFYWDLLRDTHWSVSGRSNVFFEYESSAISYQLTELISKPNGIEKVEMCDLTSAQDALNDLILTETQTGRYYSKPIPKECYERIPPIEPLLDPFWGKLENYHDLPPEVEMTLGTFNLPVRLKASEGKEGHNKYSPYNEMLAISTRAPSETKTCNYRNLPFFSLSEFFSNVEAELSAICRTMLTDNYFGIRSFVDTLVCMSGEELKYLPLWAGGNEDGTGGVFEKPIPPAEYGVAPNGPGPAYHTGLSVLSQTSSIVDVDEDDQMTEVGTVNTSIAVENGYSSHVDRRVIMSDFGSITSFVDVQEFEGNNKSKGAGHDSVQEYGGVNMSENGLDDDIHDYFGKGKDKSNDFELVEEDDFMMVSDGEDDLDDLTP